MKNLLASESFWTGEEGALRPRGEVEPEVTGNYRAQWGEGPVWWQGRLYYVDIESGRVLAYDPCGGAEQYWETGERVVLEQFADLVDIRTMGEGFTWETQDRARDIAAAEKAWEHSKAMINACHGTNHKYDMILLDEINIVLRYGYIDLTEVVTFLSRRPYDLHVIATGRNAKPELIEAADLVTEMTMIKHPFRDQGVKAQKGIEF